jgi:hypothetical protein
MFINGYPPSVCMEEESQPAGGGFQIRAGPFAKRDQDQDQDEEESERSIQSEIAPEFLMRLMKEREAILKDPKLSAKDKARLLATGQYALTIASGGKWRSFKSEQVVYAILTFSAVVLIILACLTAFFGLAKEVTIAFAGTVVGGTLTTVAQKLGRL